MEDNMAYIEIHNVEKYYGKQHVLKNLSLSVEKGKFVTLLGASGCGKSTLLRILAGLTSIDSGAIYLGEEDITHLSPNKRNIGMIFQQYSLFPTMTVYDNVAFGLKMRKMNKAQIRSMVSEAIKMVNLEGSEKKYPSHLSGGEQQRVALARCIVTRPKVLLLDEPFSAIDAKLRKSLQSKIKEIHKELGMTSIFVTHDQDEAMVMSDYIYLLNSGVIEQEGTPIELYSKPRTIFAAEFIGDYNIIDGNFLSNITGKNFTCKKIAFRPELVKICKKPLYQHVDSIYFSGVIIDIVLQGNIVRYHVMVDKTKIKVDILSSQECLYNIGDNVYLSLQMSNIIQYAE